MIIGTIGVGLFVLIIVWILALIVFVVGIKFDNNFAWLSLSTAAILTVTLVLIPIENPKELVKETDNLGKDYGYIGRVVLLSLLIISALLGSIFFFLFHCIESIRPKAVDHISSQ